MTRATWWADRRCRACKHSQSLCKSARDHGVRDVVCTCIVMCRQGCSVRKSMLACLCLPRRAGCRGGRLHTPWWPACRSPRSTSTLPEWISCRMRWQAARCAATPDVTIRSWHMSEMCWAHVCLPDGSASSCMVDRDPQAAKRERRRLCGRCPKAALTTGGRCGGAAATGWRSRWTCWTWCAATACAEPTCSAPRAWPAGGRWLTSRCRSCRFFLCLHAECVHVPAFTACLASGRETVQWGMVMVCVARFLLTQFSSS